MLTCRSLVRCPLVASAWPNGEGEAGRASKWHLSMTAWLRGRRCVFGSVPLGRRCPALFGRGAPGQELEPEQRESGLIHHCRSRRDRHYRRTYVDGICAVMAAARVVWNKNRSYGVTKYRVGRSRSRPRRRETRDRAWDESCRLHAMRAPCSSTNPPTANCQLRLPTCPDTRSVRPALIAQIGISKSWGPSEPGSNVRRRPNAHFLFVAACRQTASGKRPGGQTDCPRPWDLEMVSHRGRREGGEAKEKEEEEE